MSATTMAATLDRRHPPQRAFTRVYIWHWPVRMFHWAMAGSLVALAVTGLYIGQPYFVLAPAVTTPYLMGWMRFLHFLAAAVLVGAGVLRFYAFFMGDRYERWSSLVPVSRKSWADFATILWKYATFTRWSPPHYVGHNPLQQWSYTAFELMLVFMALTGFAMYGLANPGGFWWTATTSWIMPLLGGNQSVRLYHHLGLWVIVVFAVLHIYLAIRSDVLGDRGAVSSIVSGYKYKHEDWHYEDA